MSEDPEIPDFDETRLFERVKKYSFPRLVGSSGWHKAKNLVLGEFRDLGFDPIAEDFKFSRFFANFWVRGSLGMIAVLLFVNLLRTWIPIFTTIFGWYGMFLFGYFLIMSIVFNDPTNYRPRNIPATNIYAQLPPEKKSAGIIIVSAHYDSKSQRLTIFWRAGLAILTTILSIALVVLLVIQYIRRRLGESPNTALDWAILILTMPIMVALIALAANKIGNESPGASDNATGMACVFELAQYFRDHPLKNYSLWFVQFDAEELGTMGSRFFLRNHLEELKPKRRKGGKFRNSFNINFDMVYGEVKYIQQRKVFRQYVYKRLTTAAAESPKTLDFEPKTWYLGPGASTDRRNFSKKKIEALDICDYRGGRVAHSPDDTPDKIKPEVLRQACELAYYIIHKIDHRQLRPKHPFREAARKTVDNLKLNIQERVLDHETKKVEKKIEKDFQSPPA